MAYNITTDRLVGNTIDVQHLIDAHPQYNKYIKRWQYLADSYAGGIDYELGEYLEKYYFENGEEYLKRIRTTALDNHVKSVIGIYNSFLYRRPITRNFGAIENEPMLNAFIEDADLDGRSFEAIMREISLQTMIYGHCWIMLDKPTTQVNTRAEELEQGLRPYISIYTPENVLDWDYTRLPNGKYQLDYFKCKEEANKNTQYVREFTKEEINLYEYDSDKDQQKASYLGSIPNQLGKIPAICVYAQRSPSRGVGISPVGDIADAQKQLYDMTSEILQLIQISNHPSLVKTADVEAAAGAGAIIQMPQTMDPGLKPYLLQPSGQNIESVLNAMDKVVGTIDRQACLGGIRSVESRRLSGVALTTEFQMLNAKLSDFAHNLEHAEEQIWRLFAQYQGMAFDGKIEYPRSFSIQDKANDVLMLKMAKEGITIGNPPSGSAIKINKAIDEMIIKTLIDDDNELEEILEDKNLDGYATRVDGNDVSPQG